MTLEEIAAECLEDGIRWFPDQAQDLPFNTLALCGETGELANKVKKAMRGSTTYGELYGELVEEATDVFIYLMNIFAILEVDPEKVYRGKRAINESRFGGRVPASAE